MSCKRWIASLFEDSHKPGHASSKRLVFVVGGLTLSAATMSLSVAACFGQSVDTALMTVTTPLAALAGYGYVNGKKVERAAPKAEE